MCVHLRQLFQLCQDHNMQISGADVIRVVCHQCGEQEVCPSMMSDEYDARHSAPSVEGDGSSEADADA